MATVECGSHKNIKSLFIIVAEKSTKAFICAKNHVNSEASLRDVPSSVQ